MIRFVILCCLLTKILVTHAEENLDDTFDGGLSSQCEAISGSGSGCYECYTCNSMEANLQQRRSRMPINLTLFDNNCKGTQVCCFSQSEYDSRASSTACGFSNPQGEPRSVRESLRSVLPGQYPWRIWIYSIVQPNEPMCSGVYVDSGSRSVITLASCVKDYDKVDLDVRFSKSGANLKIRNMVLHPDYDEYEGTNDIAALFLARDALLPEWARDVCRPATPPRFATACIAISNNDKFFNTVIPKQSSCFSNTEPPHESQLCAATPRYDYDPELGSGLFCETELIANRFQFVVHGIYAKKNMDNVTMYTNVTHYYPWLDGVLEQNIVTVSL